MDNASNQHQPTPAACQYKFKTQCPNMKEREGDTSMTHEHLKIKEAA